MIILTPPTTTLTDNREGVSPPVEPVVRLGVLLTGVDGSSWDLYDGPVKLTPGARLFSSPDPELWHRDAPGLDGSRYIGERTPRGAPYLPVFIDGETELGWRDTYAGFFGAVRRKGLCTLTVTTPDATSRSLQMRYVSGSNAEYETDPLLIMYGAYGLEFASEDPYWQGEKVVVKFEDITPLSRFPGPPFNINRANTIATASVTNPGDVDAWGKWTVRAPFTGFTVGIAGSAVTYVGTKTTGHVVIDMDPRSGAVVDETGADAWLSITANTFAPIPAGRNVPLSLNLTGAGAGTEIELGFTPRYREAF